MLLALASFIFLIIVILKFSTPEASDLPGAPGLGLFPHSNRQEKLVNQLHMESPTLNVNPKAVNMNQEETLMEDYPPPNYNIHAFYYTWYGSPKFDGKYLHWDHPLLPHWDPKVAAAFPTGQHSPPDDIGSNFYPALGAYSSRDPSVIDSHMRQMRMAAIGEAMGFKDQWVADILVEKKICKQSRLCITTSRCLRAKRRQRFLMYCVVILDVYFRCLQMHRHTIHTITILCKRHTHIKQTLKLVNLM